MGIKVISAEFISGHPVGGELPENFGIEIALVGRSNVGKSTLVNRLTGRKSLAITGKTPGTTKQVNLFGLKIDEMKEGAPCWLADLPGYGFGKFSQKKRASIAKELVHYLRTRRALRVVCLLNDSKRDPEEDEIAIRNICFEQGVSLIVVATKVDRLNQRERHSRLKSLASGYGLEVQDLLATGTNHSPTEFWQRVLPLCLDKPSVTDF